jgi:hypothetical protein
MRMSQTLNNFEQLLEEEASTFDVHKRQQAREGIISTLSSYKLIGQLVTVFVPDMINVLIEATGGDQTTATDDEDKTPRQGQPPHLTAPPTDSGPKPDDDFDIIR